MNIPERELHVLYGIAAGLSLTQLAHRLGVTVHTIRHYRKRAGYKLGDGNVVRLLRSAVAADVLPADVLAMPIHRLLTKVPRATGKGVSRNVKRKR